MEEKRKWLLSSAAREKAEKESKLYYETARFVCDFYLPDTEEERKVLDVVSSNIIDIYSNYEKVFIVKHNEDDVSAVIKEYRSKVENELNYFFENMINVTTKQAIKDFIVDFKQGDVRKHAHISEDMFWQEDGVGDDDINRTGNGCRKKNNKNNKKQKQKKKKKKQKKKAKKLTQLELQQQKDEQEKLRVHLEKEEKFKQEADHYRETILFMQSFAHKKETTAQERITLYRAYINVVGVYTDFYYICRTKKEEYRNISSIIKEHRSKVEEELTYVCNKVSDVTIKQAFSQLLADFQSGPKPKDPPSQIHHPHLQDKDGNIMSSKPNMSSGEGSCKPLPICDNQLYYHDHDKCCPPFVDESKLIYEVIEWIESEDDECPDLTFADVEFEE